MPIEEEEEEEEEEEKEEFLLYNIKLYGVECSETVSLHLSHPLGAEGSHPTVPRGPTPATASAVAEGTNR